MAKQENSLTLPPAIVRRVNRAAKRQKRQPSELATEALQLYFRVSEIPEEIPTAAELRAIRRGEAALKRGDYITLDELRRKKKWHVVVAGPAQRSLERILARPSPHTKRD